MSIKSRITLPFIFSASLLGAAPLAVAENAAQTYQQPPTQQPAASNISNSQLEAYANAAQEVITIKQDLSEEMSGVDSQDKALKLQTEAQEKMVKAVESSGMSVDEYNRIATLIRTDPQMRERVQQMAN